MFSVWLALATVLLHLPFLGRYGFHGDELYFLACGQRLDFGYADHAPLVPWIAAASSGLFGDSLYGLRLAPCLAGGLTVYLSCLLCKDLGGKRFAQLLTALAVGLGPFFLRTGNQLTIPSFEPVYWTACSLLLLRIVRGADPKLWLAFGLVAGLGLMNKHTMLVYGFAAVVALVVSHDRRQALSKWFWLGGGVAALIFLPNLIWQIQHDWATVRFARNLNEQVMSRLSRLEFLLGQVLYAGPITILVWPIGLVWLLRHRDARILGLCFLFVLAVLLVTRAKIYYSLPVYPLVLAAGAVWWEDRIGTWRVGAVRAFVAAVLLGMLAFVPLALPVLPIEMVDGYAAAVSFGLAGKAHEITGDLHSQFGWKDQVAGVRAALAKLPEEQRKRAVLFVHDYGQAGALELASREDPLPPVLCLHLSYYFWSREYLESKPPVRDGSVVVTLGFSRGQLEVYQEVEELLTIAGSPYANPWEQNLPVLLARKPRKPLVSAWPKQMGL